MKLPAKALMVAAWAVVSPGYAVESVFLDSLPLSYPGEYLAPADIYFQVPPPVLGTRNGSDEGVSSVYNSSVLRPAEATIMTEGATRPSGYRAASGSESDSSDRKLRLLLKEGLDHASDVPIAVLREHFAEVEDVELVSAGDVYDVLVEVETMRPAGSATVFIVVNAYRDIDGESLIFYNNFGYLGDLKLLSGSVSYASKLQSALELEAERLDD